MLVTSINPANNAVGVALAATVSVTFDEDADPDALMGSGSFIVSTGASKLVVEGPGLEDFSPEVTEDYLLSPTFTGILKGVISTSNNRTFTFTPDSLLSPNTQYQVLISRKATSKTIEDTTSDPGNTSTGSFTVKGPYSGVDDDTFTIRIKTAGVFGVATFSYTRASEGVESADIPLERLVELEDGIFLRFSTGTYVADDFWTFDVNVPVAIPSIYKTVFTTGSPTYVEVSDDIPSFQIETREVEGLTRVDGASSVGSDALSLVSIRPVNGASNVALGFESIVLTFNKDIDPDSIDSSVIEVLMENLPMDETEQTSVALEVTATVSGKTLTLRFRG